MPKRKSTCQRIWGRFTLPEEPGGVERVLRLVGEAFDRKLRAA